MLTRPGKEILWRVNDLDEDAGKEGPVGMVSATKERKCYMNTLLCYWNRFCTLN